ncbi:hypothetical protein B0T20DRAFT_235450 [Sordaria brevicollis]|uniref:Uncharacterized protein n=1 Tax=Sordaria brevicollis TaxID=83679 RepID=A0AAE0UBS1_SORBR|nr:hypothetical protein B0T20DRAFT_235450 [Sordaria brevicollis]
MSSDEFMPDSVAHTSSPRPADNSNGNGNNGSTAFTRNTEKFRRDFTRIFIKLTDRKFSSTNFRDPLMPCPPHLRQYPGHTTPATERRLKELIKRIKDGSGGTA